MIYKLAFDRDGSQPAAYHLNVLCTCRAIHDEAAALAYNMHTPVIHIENHGEDNGAWYRDDVWRMHRRQAATIGQLSFRVAELRPHIAAIITSLHVHELTSANPLVHGEELIERLIPDVRNIAGPLDSLIHLRGFSWAVHSCNPEYPLRIPGYPMKDYVDNVSKRCAAGVHAKIVHALPETLQNWPSLEKITLHLPNCLINVPSAMLALRKHIPDSRPRPTRQVRSSNAPRISAGDDALADPSQLRLKIFRGLAKSDVVLRIKQDVTGETQCMRKRISDGMF